MDRHEQLWAPWRLAYVSGETPSEVQPPQPVLRADLDLLPGADADCFLCRAAVDPDQQATLVVERSRHSLVILNRFPYTNGHLLISPLAHQGRLDEIDEHAQLDMQRLIAKYLGLLEGLVKAEGFNVGLNLGRAAGAGVPGHLHWHLVPRWSGDTNFMASLAGIRVIPQALQVLWELLREADHPPAGRVDDAAP